MNDQLLFEPISHSRVCIITCLIYSNANEIPNNSFEIFNPTNFQFLIANLPFFGDSTSAKAPTLNWVIRRIHYKALI